MLTQIFYLLFQY